jgi:poly(hydroxyalkanoate) depolymerase family esterase
VIDVAWTESGERPGAAFTEVFTERSTRRSARPAAPEPTAGAQDVAPFMRDLLRGARFDVPAAPASRPLVPARGEFIAGSFTNAAGTRPYKLFVPTGQAGLHRPLVVMLHGCTQSPDDFANGTQMNAAAERHGCYVLYPGQTTTANASGCWNWFRPGDQQRGRGEPSILAGMIGEVVAQHGIDRSKVFAAGLSAGGAMAAVMAVAYPELFAAVGVHSGLACGAANNLPSALSAMRGAPQQVRASTGAASVPAIVFHGDRDRTVHPHNGDHVVRTMRDEAASGNATVERAQAPGGRAYTRTVHRGADGRAALEYWVVHGGGHAWFGGSAQGSYTDPEGPNATDEMLRFFLQA